MLFVDYVAEIFDTLMTTPRDTLRLVANELKEMVPAPLHSMLEKESREDAVSKYQARKQKETIIVPPTCTGISLRSKGISYSKQASILGYW